jgi:DNA-binding SARP family transcriptional activator
VAFNVLGTLEVTHNGHICTPTAMKVRWTLAVLVCRANQIVGVDALIDELWGSRPPRSAVTTAQTYIYQLRKFFEREMLATHGEELLETRSPGYLLRLNEEQVDAVRFEQLAREGRMLFEQGKAAPAADRLRQALSLWRGRALANIPVGKLLEAHVVHLEETRLRALELRIRADIAIGRHRELIPELHSLVSQYPLNEWLHGQLISALHQSGRRGEALRAYQKTRDVLNTELGLEPSATLQRLQYQILNAHDPVTADQVSEFPVALN